MTTKVMVHKVLDKLIKENGLNSTKLSKALNIPNSTIASYLSGKKASYSPEHLLIIAKFFNVTIEYLLSGKDTPQANLNSLPVEKIFSGWLKVNIERVIPIEEDADD